MISISDLYHVLTAVVPLYVAMFLAYCSVKWWKIFTPVQCSGINRFVALFAVPLLSFHFISSNNPYAMNYRFIAADTLQKLIVLAALSAWTWASRRGSLDWAITVFSVSTLPNTLVMGIPLLKGMYGDSSGTLMVQVVVLQCIIWYTLLLFLFEFRGARILIADQFPDNAASIVSFQVDSDVISLDGKEALETRAEVGEDGKLHVTVRKSSASRSEILSGRSHSHGQNNSGLSFTPRVSNLSNAEIYSLQSSRNPTPRGSSFNHADFHASGFDEESGFGRAGFHAPGAAGIFSPMTAPAGAKKKIDGVGKDLHMFVWSSGGSPVSCHQLPLGPHPKDYDEFGQNENENKGPVLAKIGSSGSTAQLNTNVVPGTEPTAMPPATVLTKLILIMVWRKLIRNPNSYSSLIGITWSLIAFKWNVEMPEIVAGSIAILSKAGLGMAMFSLGLFMALQPRMIACGKAVAGFSMAVRFIVGPAVMAAASLVVGLRGVLLHIAIVQASLPQGIVPFVFAKEYNVHPDILSTGVIFGMLIALPITLVYYILLGL
ncbi:unnamed protein product [Cuscuta campestris]|uniref:Auxin efflux carrier component n=1 Tax=Cuscuta campestris TaxID=132261 RepID=A0A484MTJ7_9ASTE|nr:unnamed protein product [Cuscuta campestris]